MTAMTFAIGGIGFWMPSYIYEFRLNKQADLGHINLIFGAITVVAGFSATLAGGWAGDKLRKRYPGSYFLVSAAGLLTGFPLLLAIIYTPFPLAWVFVFLAVFCLFFNTGPSNTILANVTHPSMRATAFALNILVIHALGDAISPPVMGWISDRWNMNVAFQFVGLMFLVGGLLWLWGAKYLAQDTAHAPNLLDDRPPLPRVRSGHAGQDRSVDGQPVAVVSSPSRQTVTVEPASLFPQAGAAVALVL
jgi:MFS family permease